VDTCVSIYTITFNQRERLAQTLDALFRQDYPKNLYQIIVLDDGSTDGTGDLLENLAANSPVELIRLACAREGDYLSAKRWNQCLGACSAQSEALIQIDDVVTRPDFIRQHVKWHVKTGDFLVTGSKFEGDEETWDLSSCVRNSLAGPGGVAAPVASFTAVWGASLSFSRRMLERVYSPPHDIPYDERMRGWGFHEVELAFRLQSAGARIIYDPAAGVFHRNHNAESEGRRGLDRESLVRDGTHQNSVYLLEKHRLAEMPRW
jgi:glycosyltransferase involved in cell wall biosynthesis